MATDKLFTVAGTSRHPSLGHKVRFATDVLRVKNLAKSGHSDIFLIELAVPMTKLDAVNFIRTLDEFSGVAEQAAIADYLDKETPRTPKSKAAPTMESIKAKAKTKAKAKAAPQDVGLATDLEDLPFGTINPV